MEIKKFGDYNSVNESRERVNIDRNDLPLGMRDALEIYELWKYDTNMYKGDYIGEPAIVIEIFPKGLTGLVLSADRLRNLEQKIAKAVDLKRFVINIPGEPEPHVRFYIVTDWAE